MASIGSGLGLTGGGDLFSLTRLPFPRSASEHDLATHYPCDCKQPHCTDLAEACEEPHCLQSLAERKKQLSVELSRLDLTVHVRLKMLADQIVNRWVLKVP